VANKSVLLVGTSFSAVPLLYSLKSRNCTVSVCGNMENDPAIALADHYYNVDYSKKENLLDLAKMKNIDFIIPSCNDYSYLSCAWIAEQLGYPGYDSYETARILHTKDEFKSFAIKHGLPTPKTIITSQLLDDVDKFDFPVLVKPIDSFSGRGMTKLYNRDKLTDAIDHAIEISRTNQYLIEEFVGGTLHSHSAFIKDEKISTDFFVDEHCTVYPYEVNCSCLSWSLSKQIINQVRSIVNNMISLLKLKDGLLHTQFIQNGNNIWLIESMRRCPGDLYGKLIELSAEVNYHKIFISPFIELEMPDTNQVVKNKFFSRHTISTTQTMCVKSFSHSIPSKNVSICSLKNSGEVLQQAPFDKLAILFSEFGSRKELLKRTPILDDYIQIQAYGDR
jgi:formate-dependent phosphoribosylglycinamide formyltransferase (GAR transformylase)